jgi:hypothetical protein
VAQEENRDKRKAEWSIKPAGLRILICTITEGNKKGVV